MFIHYITTAFGLDIIGLLLILEELISRFV